MACFMRIAKYLNHLGVDSMLKTALGDDLTVFRFNDSTGWITRDQISFDYVDGNLADQDWDLFIFDDIYTVTNYFEQPVRAKHHVWYCHGTYDTWHNAQTVFNMRFENVPLSAIFTDEYKHVMVDQWRKFPLQKTLTLPIALSDDKFCTVPEKNGRVCTIGNDYNRICSIYPRYETFAKPGIEQLIQRYANCYDAYGWNGEVDGNIFGDFRRGSANIAQLGAWSASIHLSGVASIGFVLAECFAAGIPVISTPKYQLPCDGSWICAETVDQMILAVDELLSNPARARDLGCAGQDMFKRNFGIDQYGQRLRSWLKTV
jgi:hypothetical protein